ncbi:MAG: hypothetical protein H8D26_02040 [Methanomicrobia archaeon]|nr:hypothetical protein [Methanomicrobia archaeon]
MAETNVGERIASLEARFNGFQQRFDTFQDQMSTNQGLIMGKLDKIEGGFEARRTRVDNKFSELDKKTPALIQQIVLVLSTGVVMAVVSYLISGLP